MLKKLRANNWDLVLVLFNYYSVLGYLLLFFVPYIQDILVLLISFKVVLFIYKVKHEKFLSFLLVIKIVFLFYTVILLLVNYMACIYIRQ